MPPDLFPNSWPGHVSPYGNRLSQRTAEGDYSQLVNTPLQPDETPIDWGCWAPTVQLVKRLGASDVQALGAGLGVAFAQFATETQIYPTRAVVAMSALGRFNLGDEVGEKRAFSVQLMAEAYLGGRGAPGALDIGFAPMPDRSTGIDGVELARRYLGLLLGLLEKQSRLWSAAPPVFHEAKQRMLGR